MRRHRNTVSITIFIDYFIHARINRLSTIMNIIKYMQINIASCLYRTVFIKFPTLYRLFSFRLTSYVPHVSLLFRFIFIELIIHCVRFTIDHATLLATTGVVVAILPPIKKLNFLFDFSYIDYKQDLCVQINYILQNCVLIIQKNNWSQLQRSFWKVYKNITVINYNFY